MSYPLTARTLPVVLALAPLIVVAASVVSTMAVPAVTVPGSAVLLTALSTLISHLGRDAGKRIEPTLWHEWGGPPTTQLLRWRAARPSEVAVSVRHQHVATLVAPSVRLPSAAEEAAAPESADDVYDVAVGLLRGMTRDASRFPLLKHENVGYGFRRNLFGLRTVGTVAAATALPAAVAFLTLGIVRGRASDWLCAAAIAAASLIALTLWRGISGSWVERVAWAYAERLFEAAHVLAAEHREPASSSEVAVAVATD